ncbi:MAG: cytochrome c family protein [Spirochaetes bacterium]|nr:cytochrome c family protein [Spirochaetota bacterium]
MKIFKLFPLFLCLLFSIIFVACEIDPWTQGGNRVDTDVMVIKKITAYGEQVDGTLYKGNVGAVTMSHSVHEQQGVKCFDCHHKNGNDDRIKECAKCHSGDKGYNTMHGLCVDCHISKNKGPQKCMECH